MVCPECGSEYVDGYTRCASCDIDLIEPAPPEPEIALVKVYETANAAVIPLFQSLMEAAEIEFMTKNESLQDFFGGGRFPSGFGIAVGPVEFFVREEDADDARAIVATLEQPLPADAEVED